MTSLLRLFLLMKSYSKYVRKETMDLCVCVFRVIHPAAVEHLKRQRLHGVSSCLDSSTDSSENAVHRGYAVWYRTWWLRMLMPCLHLSRPRLAANRWSIFSSRCMISTWNSSCREPESTLLTRMALFASNSPSWPFVYLAIIYQVF